MLLLYSIIKMPELQLESSTIPSPMEEPNPNSEEDDQFFDASDDFPFSDCTDAHQSELSTSDSTLSHLEPSKDEPPDSLKPQHSPEYSSPPTLRRRKSLYKNNRRRTSCSGESPNDPEYSTVSSVTSLIDDQSFSREKIYEINCNSKEIEGEKDHNSELTQGRVSSANNDPVDVSVAELEESSSSHFLVYLTGLMIKAIGFQIKLIISIFTFPIWSLYNCYMFVIDPFKTIRRGGGYLMGNVLRVWCIVCENVSPSVYEWLKEQKSIWKLVLQFGWGFLWAAYVCIVLCVLLMSSFVISGFVIRYVVKEPIQMEETLNFDYTRNSPVAFVPIISCPDVTCGLHCKEKIDVGKSIGLRKIPPNHKLQVSFSLTLPESEYNRNLGMFQVRVDFLSANGNALGSLRRLCMLQYKSLPIRLLLTFLKTFPLVTGYSSESQTLNVKMKGFIEGDLPTSCLKVVIEQRAEFRPGAGIPEIYAASLKLESELPLVKRLMWYWKRTLFVWISITLFIMELLLALLCCRPIIIPRVRIRNGPAGSSTPRNSPTRSS